ncbi:uncharacterized protein, partial [Littorina saxatilis]|uniref:uncharacterized protein n=1 Tax=Littorina saxatilis TaxID=31220 RepID=UPI0038B661F3
MAQADWLREVMNELEDGDSLVSIVSSADIDALPIHLFALGRFWQRSEDRSFKVPVHLVLQKAKGRMDVYNVCKIARALEHRFGDDAAMRVAVALTLGGNDFLPKFEGISHKTVVDSIIRNGFLQDFVKFRSDGGGELTSGKLDRDIYLRLIKHLYCPAVYNPENLTATEVRHLSITSAKKGYKDPNKWMPPVSALLQVAQLIDLQIQYLFTAGNHSAKLPDFLEHDCFIQDEKGRIRHNFGPERRAEELNELLVLDEEHLKRSLEMAKHNKGKRLQDDTPQKGKRRKAAKRQLTSTPRKDTDAATILVNFVDESSASSDDNDAAS